MRTLKLCSILSLSALAVGLSSPTLFGQSAPPNGMRAADLRTHAIVDARVVIRPGVVLERATIVIKDGVIIEVGENVQPPRDARIWSGEGLTVYPGLIEPALLIKPGEREDSPGAHWNMHIHPEIDMIDQPSPDEELRKEMRSMGFTAAAVYPDSGIWRGTGTVIALADSDEHALSYLDRTAMAAGFSTTRGFGRGNYPGSLMGAIALMRQTLLDAQWHATSRDIWEQYPEGNEPPIRADALDAMVPVLGRQQTVLFDVSDELNALRAHRVGTEFNLDMTLLGSGLEFRRLDEIVATNRAIIVPLNYPKTPEVTSVSEADRASLRDLMTWEQAPTNPRRLIQAGITVALTTHRLEKRKDFFKNLRLAIKHGLSEDDALASLTTTPATMLGLEKILGTVETGKAANLVVVEGGLFDKDAKIRDTWINGRRHEISTKPLIELKGKYAFWTSHGHTSQADIDTEKKSVTFDLADDKELKAKKVVVKKDLITIVVSGEALETDGYVQLSGVVTGDSITGNGIMPDGDRFQFTFTPTPDANDDEQSEDDTDEAKDDDKSDEVIGGLPPEELVMPLGAYGVDASPTSQKIYVRGATIWTEGPEGIIEDGCLIIAGGKIAYVGPASEREPTPDMLIIEAEGKHVTPGLLDCHSHTGISGGVNEGSQAVTAEVRIADVINPDDINFYRQLAGGLTTINQLHGSANPIGGQNSVIKLKWGAATDQLRIPDAIEGIKFALGENPKRSSGRYPDTRMGVATVIRDAFTAARDYKKTWDRYLSRPTEQREKIMPPRRDLELDALVEILDGERLVHCHSYRQDEILMLIRIADDFGFTIGTFQHVLEGYKIAEALAKHGAGASTFSDWWAYKVEVMDAIPFNGALMTNVGVVVSFNSDSSELARRMNTEASKAVRYGGLDPHEALKLVTINPAKQLRIDHRVGSLEVGKDADFVVWSGSPLSTYTRCEQTWIEGARYFDLRIDEMLRKKAKSERQRIIQKIHAQSHDKKKNGKDEKNGGEDRPRRRPHEITQLEQRMLQDWQMGRDPLEIRPGDCCSQEELYELMNSTGGER